MATQNDAVKWYYDHVIGRHNTYSHGPGGLGGRFLEYSDGNISTDCSGSTWAAYHEACGIQIGLHCGVLAESTGQWIDGPSDEPHTPDVSKLAPGDLLLFRGKTAGRPWGSSHVEMYLGNGQCAGCGSTKVVNPGSCTTAYWANKYIGAKRVIPDGASVGGGFNGSGGPGGLQFRISECPDDVKFKGVWDRYRAQSGYYLPSCGGAYGDGMYNVPGGFPSDDMLYSYLSTCESHVTIKWSTSPDGPPIAAGVQFGYDLPGGVHAMAVVNATGISLEMALGYRSPSQVNWTLCRRGLGSEVGNAYTAYLQRPGKYESDIVVPQEYWNRLVPYYRDRIIEGWNLPIAQREPNLAKRWALCHGMCWGYSKAFANPSTPYHSAWQNYATTDEFINNARLPDFIKKSYKNGVQHAAKLLGAQI